MLEKLRRKENLGHAGGTKISAANMETSVEVHKPKTRVSGPVTPLLGICSGKMKTLLLLK